MSEESLRRLLERLNSDAEFRDRIERDWESVIDELDLSPAEQVALATQDEDALRRLAGADVSPYMGDYQLFGSMACSTKICLPRPPQPKPIRITAAPYCTEPIGGCL